MPASIQKRRAWGRGIRNGSWSGQGDAHLSRAAIDDYHTKGQDLSFAALDAHPNIEVRVFNPFARGRFRLTQFIGRFAELHHRMHNKMFLIDGKVAVVGGRNLADDYFGLGTTLDFRDFDPLAIGEVVPRTEVADTEAVFVVHSPELASKVLEAFDTDFQSANAWYIGQVARRKKVAWITEQPGGVVVEPHEAASAWRRIVRSIAKLLPLRHYL